MFEKPEEQMGLAELQDKFDHMARNLSPQEIMAAKEPGPLSKDEHRRRLQELHRRILEVQEKTGVRLSETPGSPMHHQV